MDIQPRLTIQKAGKGLWGLECDNDGERERDRERNRDRERETNQAKSASNCTMIDRPLSYILLRARHSDDLDPQNGFEYLKFILSEMRGKGSHENVQDCTSRKLNHIKVQNEGSRLLHRREKLLATIALKIESQQYDASSIDAGVKELSSVDETGIRGEGQFDIFFEALKREGGSLLRTIETPSSLKRFVFNDQHITNDETNGKLSSEEDENVATKRFEGGQSDEDTGKVEIDDVQLDRIALWDHSVDEMKTVLNTTLKFEIQSNKHKSCQALHHIFCGASDDYFSYLLSSLADLEEKQVYALCEDTPLWRLAKVDRQVDIVKSMFSVRLQKLVAPKMPSRLLIDSIKKIANLHDLIVVDGIVMTLLTPSSEKFILSMPIVGLLCNIIKQMQLDVSVLLNKMKTIISPVWNGLSVKSSNEWAEAITMILQCILELNHQELRNLQTIEVVYVMIECVAVMCKSDSVKVVRLINTFVSKYGQQVVEKLMILQSLIENSNTVLTKATLRKIKTLIENNL